MVAHHGILKDMHIVKVCAWHARLVLYKSVDKVTADAETTKGLLI